MKTKPKSTKKSETKKESLRRRIVAASELATVVGGIEGVEGSAL